MTDELFIVEYEDGEMLDNTGDGGFTVFTARAEAQDACDSEIDSAGEHPDYLKVVRFTRAIDALGKEQG